MDVSNKKKHCTDVKNLKQWFDSTDKKYDSLKYRMKYMKILYHDMPEIQESKNSLNSLNWQNSKIKPSNNDETVISKQMNCNNSFDEYSNTQNTLVNENNDDTIEQFEPFVSSDLASSLSRSDMQNREETKLRNKQKETEIELPWITPRTYGISQNAHTQSVPVSPIQKGDILREEQNYNWQQHPYQTRLAEYSTELVENMQNSSKSFERLILDNENEYLLQELASVRDDIKLNISANVNDASVDKSKICTKSEKKEKAICSALSNKKGSLCKIDDTVSLKVKKRRRKVHSSNSRSTVTTRDTSYLGKKETKRRKQKSSKEKDSISNRHAFKSPNQQTSNEVVEIYHNTAAKSGSTSAIPSKHSKLDHHMNYINVLTSSAINKQQSVSVKPKCEDNAYQHPRDINTDNAQASPQKQYQSQQKAEGRNLNSSDGNYNLEVSPTPLCAVQKCNSHKGPNTIIQASYCDPIITHNYEMPTLASKLKRANRSYFGRFNFRNIPFVVGTSVTPSHNLGLNIQQVLSIMKTRQSVANGITPLLIRKISRGIKPASVLMGQMSDQQSKLPPHMNPQMAHMQMQQEGLIGNKDEHLLNNENMFLNLDRKGDTKSENQLNMLNATQILHATTENKMLKLFASQQNLKAETGVPSAQLKSYQDSLYNKQVSNTSSLNQSQDSKGIREVLINLHDQFEEMNAKYEKLQAKTKKCSDKDLEEEILHLEKELSAKEDEINAVVNLYKEVMALKHQMRLLQEKSGYVCISTEIPLGSNKLYPIDQFASTKSYGSSFQHRFQHRRGSSVISTREPTSLRLAGLLRQIQTFQKQLQLMSW